MTGKTLNTFKDSYQNSEEERLDVLAAYKSANGDINMIFRRVMLSNPLDDEERFKGYIEQAIEAGEVAAHEAYTEEPVKRKEKRHKDAAREGVEAKEHAKKLGVYDQVFGGENGESGKKSGNKGSKKGSHDDLGDLIQQRQKARAGNFLDDLEAKYAPGNKGGAKAQIGKKRKNEEPPEELFQRNRRQKKGNVSKVEEADEEEVDLEVKTASEDEVEEEDEAEEEVKPTKSKSRATRRTSATKASGRKGRKKGPA